VRKLILIFALLTLFVVPAIGGTFVQTQGGEASSSATVSATFASTTITGNLIVVSCAAYSDGNFSAADGGTNTFTQIRQTTWNNNEGNSVLWTGYVQNATGKASHQITCTNTVSNFRMAIRITEYSGIATTGALDQNAGSSGLDGTAASSGNTTTTAQANELLYGAIMAIKNTGAGTITAGASYTVRGSTLTAGNYIRLADEDRNVTSTGTYPADATISTSNDWAAHIVTFKDAAAGSYTPRHRVIIHP